MISTRHYLTSLQISVNEILKINYFLSMKTQNKSYIYALTAILLWSTVASAFKISLRFVDFLHLLLYSSGIAVVLLFIVVVFQKKTVLLKKSSVTDYLQSAFIGFLNPYLYYVVLLKAYSILPAQEAMTLNYTWPIMLVLLSIVILKQRITLKSLFSIGISFFGVIIIATRGDVTALQFHNPFGVSLAIGSSVVWALFWILNMQDHRDEVVKLFLNFIFGFLFIGLTILLFSKPILPSVKGLPGAMYIGFFEMGVPFVCWLIALQLSETTARISNLAFLSPFLSLIFISVVVGEKISCSTVLGLFFIIAGIIIQQYSERK